MVYLTIKVTIFIGFCSCITYFTLYFLTFLDLLFFGLHLCFYHYNFFVLLVGKFIYDFHWTKKKTKEKQSGSSISVPCRYLYVWGVHVVYMCTKIVSVISKMVSVVLIFFKEKYTWFAPIHVVTTLLCEFCLNIRYPLLSSI